MKNIKKVNQINTDKQIQKFLIENKLVYKKYFYYDDKQNLTIINLDLTNRNIYKEDTDNSKLDEDIFIFLEDIFKLSNNKLSDFLLKIKYKENTSLKEKEKITRLLKLNYALKYQENKKQIKRTNIISLILLLIGALILVAFALLQIFIPDFVLNEIIDIFAWVFIWESCDLFVFRSSSLKIENRINMHFFNMKIEEIT